MKEILKKYKEATNEQISIYCLPIEIDGNICGRLRPVTKESIQNPRLIEMLSTWRRAANEWFTTQFPVTEQGTKLWLEEQVLKLDNRILFVLESADLTPIGQVGLCNIDQEKSICELDNILRGDNGLYPGLMSHACRVLLNWSFNVLNMQTAYLRVLSDNSRAIRLYQKLGFQEIQRMPLIKITEGDVIRWVPPIDQLYCKVDRYLVSMRLKRENINISK